jgi:hypothetical protein
MDDDLKDAMREDRNRGRRKIDLETQRKRKEKLKLVKELLQISTQEEFLATMRTYGLRDGSPEFLEALRAWREFSF